MAEISLNLKNSGITMKNIMEYKEQVEKILEEDLTIEEKVSKMIKKCNARGGNDNISVALLEMKSGCES